VCVGGADLLCRPRDREDVSAGWDMHGIFVFLFLFLSLFVYFYFIFLFIFISGGGRQAHHAAS
jgi:hypothetical protein